VGITTRQCHEQVRERYVGALDGDGDAEFEPVVVAGHLGGGQGDGQRVARLAVVGRFAADLDEDIRPVGQQRQGLGGEPHGVDAPELGARHDRPRQVEVGHHGPLRVRVPVVIAGFVQRGAAVHVADPVVPLPRGRQHVVIAVGQAQHQGRATIAGGTKDSSDETTVAARRSRG